MSSDPVIRAQNLSKSYMLYSRPYFRLLDPLARRAGLKTGFSERYDALSDVTFDVQRGETVALLGRNGSGKSTTLQLIAGTLAPSGGLVQVSGRLSALLELGTGFNGEYTGRENLRLNARIMGLSDTEIDVIEPDIVGFADIGHFIDEPVRTYSSGMYVRLAFATAVHVYPDVLVVDEALAVGDVFFQQKCLDYLATRMAETTKLFVTHDMSMASRLARRGLLFEGGQLLFDGDIEEAVKRYTVLGLRDRQLPPRVAAASDNRDVESRIEVGEEGIVWREVGADSNSQPEAAMVNHASIRTTGRRGEDSSWVSELVAHPGEQVELAVHLHVKRFVGAPVMGTFLRDRTGLTVCGQNTTVFGDQPALRPGFYLIKVRLDWPLIQDGTYTVCFGLGDGHDSHMHEIVNWAMDLVAVTSIAKVPVHGLFNLGGFELDCYSAEG